MIGPEILARLERGEPAASLAISSVIAPYSEIATRMLNADGRGKAVTLQEALADLPESTSQKIRREIDGELDRLNGLHIDAREKPEAGPSTRYTVHSAAEALEPQPPIDWIVENLFEAGSVSIVYGVPGCKKTWLMLHGGVCVAMGLDWLGHRTQQVKTLVIDEESGERRLKRRLGQIMRGHCAGKDIPLVFTTLEGFNLHHNPDKCIAELRQLLTDTKARFVVIDALADIMAGGDENLVKDVLPVMLALRWLAQEFQAAIVIIHHAGKNGEYRGSSGFSGAVEMVVKVTSPSDSDKIRFKSEKQRDVPTQAIVAGISITPDKVIITRDIHGSGESARQGKKLPTASKRYVLVYLRHNGASFKPTIEENAEGCTSGAARQAIYGLVDDELVYRTNEDEPGEAEYDLTDAGHILASQLESQMAETAAQN